MVSVSLKKSSRISGCRCAINRNVTKVGGRISLSNLSKRLQCGNGIFFLTVFFANQRLHPQSPLLESLYNSMPFMHLFDRIAGQIRLLGCSLRQKQEHALLLRLHYRRQSPCPIRSNSYQLYPAANYATVMRFCVSPGSGSISRHFLVNGFSLFKCV